jgi:hypothetical protein
MQSSEIALQISPNRPDLPLGLTVMLDETEVFSTPRLTTAMTLRHRFNDSPSLHRLQVQMFGKTTDHTTVDLDGNIISDSYLQISKIVLSDVDITHVYYDTTRYSHDFNGTADRIENDGFSGIMGCNGHVTFDFQSPVALWILENF